MSENRSSISRRDFIVGTTALWISATLARPRTAAAAAASSAPTSLNPSEWKAVEAITARILPTDDMPGALEAGCVNFIDKALTAEDAPALPAYRAALAALDVHCRKGFESAFADLEPTDQDSVLSDLELGRIPDWSAPDAQPEAFFQTVRMHTILGFVLPPRHGGNRDHVGWKTMGWAGPTHSLGGSQPDQMLGKRPIVPSWERGGRGQHDH